MTYDLSAPDTFGRAAGNVYIAAVVTAREPRIMGYEKLHELGMRALEMWFEQELATRSVENHAGLLVKEATLADRSDSEQTGAWWPA